MPPGVSFNTCDVEPSARYDRGRATYFDGSGASNPGTLGSSEYLGWVWLQWFPQPHDTAQPAFDSDDIGQYSIMSGSQTVPRAEIQALFAAVAYITSIDYLGYQFIFSDNQAVCDGWKLHREAMALGGRMAVWMVYVGNSGSSTALK